MADQRTSTDRAAAGTNNPPTEPRERIVRSDRHMTDVEALMWNVEKDPYLSSTFGNVTVLDRPPDLPYFERKLLRMVERIPRLRQRVSPALGRLAPPEWEDDPDFDIRYHLRHIALPPPGEFRQLLDLATMLVHDPFDRTRPLWEFYVVEGLTGGKAAIIQKMHHTITDGEGGIRMSEQFIDVTRELKELPLVTIEPSSESSGTNIFEAAAETLGHTWRRGLGVAQRAALNTADALTHPAKLADLGPELVGILRSTVRQVTVTDAAHSPLWAHRTLRRRLETLDLDFDDAYRCAKALGGSLNDFFVTGAARGAGRYHAKLGAPVETLRMAMPISTRTDRSAGGNSFVPTRVVLPVSEADPVEHFAQIHELLNQIKQEKMLGLVEAVAGLANLLPTSVLVRFTRQQVETVDFTTSNVRAAPFDLFIAGGLIEANYPIGPLGGTAFNLTMMSYRGTLNMGLHVDAGAVTEPALLRDCINEAYAELLAAGR
ncbi:MAG: WS/DGAT domain-containing protein [Acidimicrobiales bacterium]|nr:WS/DGAT domain-containing protein [Acidimicrobiales bacterium]